MKSISQINVSLQKILQNIPPTRMIKFARLGDFWPSKVCCAKQFHLSPLLASIRCCNVTTRSRLRHVVNSVWWEVARCFITWLERFRDGLEMLGAGDERRRCVGWVRDVWQQWSTWTQWWWCWPDQGHTTHQTQPAASTLFSHNIYRYTPVNEYVWTINKTSTILSFIT